MSSICALLLGASLALALIAAGMLFGGSSGWAQLIILLPPLALGSVSLWAPPRGWSRRLGRGLLGATVAAIVALLLILRLPALFPFPADQGGALYIALLIVLAAIPGFTAAASAKPGFGRALAVGFVFGLSAPLLLHDQPGIPILLGSGALFGAIVASLPVGRSA